MSFCVQRSAWFDSGYMHCVSLRGFLEEFWGCPDSVENCEVSARVLGHGRRHLSRGAEAVSLGLAIQQSIEISQLRLIDKVFDDLAVQQFPRVQAWRRRSRFHSCSSVKLGW